ncbi:MAG: saccharopine dehydrogenase family protein [Acidobacteriota bacterium]
MARVLVLGAGLVGRSLARRIAAEPRCRVTVCDRDPAALEALAAAGLETRAADALEPGTLDAVAAGVDAAVNALPGALGFRALAALLARRVPVVDISFMPEDPRTLDAAARAAGVPAVTDCGLMPGLGGMLAVHLAGRLDAARSARILVGGLPVERTLPFEYKAPFSPSDVIEEYVRPARIRRGGREVVRPALSGIEHVDVPGVGTLEAFLTDGLRTLLDTLPLDELCEKTLRYPGHARAVEVLRSIGLFDERPVALGETRVAPRDLAARLLRDAWRLGPDDDELTVMRVEVAGERGGRAVMLGASLVERRDRESGESSMARTTGVPALVALRRVLDGTIAEPGVLPAELIARDDARFSGMLSEMAAEGVRVAFDERDAGQAG